MLAAHSNIPSQLGKAGKIVHSILVTVLLGVAGYSPNNVDLGPTGVCCRVLQYDSMNLQA